MNDVIRPLILIPGSVLHTNQLSGGEFIASLPSLNMGTGHSSELSKETNTAVTWNVSFFLIPNSPYTYNGSMYLFSKYRMNPDPGSIVSKRFSLKDSPLSSHTSSRLGHHKRQRTSCATRPQLSLSAKHQGPQHRMRPLIMGRTFTPRF